MAEPVGLQHADFQHIHFRRIKPTTVSFEPGSIHFDVDKSSSFLLRAFDNVKTVRRISFEWKADGMLNKHNPAQEKSRAGDDAWLRVGLIINGQPEPIPAALLPRWLQQVRKTLKHPSDQMIYLIPDALHEPGQTWRSPYSPSINMISVASEPMAGDWKQVSYQFADPQQTVGLWLMADGDNTASIFRSQIRNLVIE